MNEVKAEVEAGTEFIPALKLVNNVPKVNSKDIARIFHKSHKNVIRDIENKLSELPEDWRRLNFEPTLIRVQMPNNATREDKTYDLTKDGFSFLVMGFTGKKATDFKIAYINAFNRMENAVHQRISAEYLEKQLRESIVWITKEVLREVMASMPMGAVIVKSEILENPVADADPLYTLGEVAGMLKTRGTSLLLFLHNVKVIKKSGETWIPDELYLNLIKVKSVKRLSSDGREFANSYLLFTQSITDRIIDSYSAWMKLIK